jgi:hypothetical protein
MALKDSEIRRIVEIELRLRGNIHESNKEIEDMVAALKRLGPTATDNLKEASRQVDILHQALRTAYPSYLDQLRAFERMAEGSLKMGGAFGKLNEHFVRLRTTVASAMGPLTQLAGLVGGADFGFSGGFKYLTSFNQEILKAGASFAKYGTGVQQISDKTNSLAKVLTLTRKETLSLQVQLEKGLNLSGWDRGAKLLQNIRGLIGPDAQAMGEFSNFVTSIAQKFPDLEDSLVRMNAADRKLIGSQSQLLYLSGAISQADSKRLRDYAKLSEQVTVADLKQRREVEAQVESVKRMQQTFERVAIIVGQTIAPLFEKLSVWMDRQGKAIENWVPALTKVGIALAGIAATLKALQLANTFGGLMGVGKNWSGLFGGGRFGAAASQAGRVGSSAAIGYVAGKAIDAGYEGYTGKEAGTSGFGNYARVGAKYATSVGTGAAMGGPVGAAVGAGVTTYDEIANTVSYTNKLREEGLKNEAMTMHELNRLTKEFASNVGKASTASEKEYNELMRAYYAKLQNANKLGRESDQSPWFGTQSRKATNAKFADAQQTLAKAQSTEFFKQLRQRANATALINAAVTPTNVDRNIFKSFVAGGGIYDGGALKRSQGAIEDAYQNTKVKNILGGFSKDLLDEFKLTDIADNGKPFGYRSTEMDRVSEAYRKSGEKVDEAKASGNEDELKKALKYQMQLAAQMEQATKATASIRDLESQRTAYLAEQLSIIESQNQFYQQQRQYVDAIAQKLYLTGNSNYSELFEEADQAVRSLNISLDAQKAKLDYLIAGEKEVIAAKEASLKKDEERLKTGGMTDDEKDKLQASIELDRARLNLGKSQVTVFTAQKQALTAQANKENEIANIAMSVLQVRQKEAALLQEQSTAYSALLALQTQYGNSASAGFATSMDILKSLDKQIEEYQELLGQVDQLRKKYGDSRKLQEEELNYTTQINQKRAQQLEILRNIANLNKTNVDYASAQAEQIQTMIELQDNLAMGVAASAETRMRAATAIGRVIEEEKVNLRNVQQALAGGQAGAEQSIRDSMAAQLRSAGKNQSEIAEALQQNAAAIQGEAKNRILSLDTERVKKETQILRLMQQQAQLTKSIRDGYVDAIRAMTAGTGMFAKLMVTQEKNIGVGVTYFKGFVQSMRSGGVDLTGRRSVGQRGSSKFGLGGVEGPAYDFSRRPDYYNGGPEIGQFVKTTEAQQRQYLGDYLARQNGRIQSQTGMGFGAAPNQGAVLDAARNAPNGVMAPFAGGGAAVSPAVPGAPVPSPAAAPSAIMGGGPAAVPYIPPSTNGSFSNFMNGARSAVEKARNYLGTFMSTPGAAPAPAVAAASAPAVPTTLPASAPAKVQQKGYSSPWWEKILENPAKLIDEPIDGIHQLVYYGPNDVRKDRNPRKTDAQNEQEYNEWTASQKRVQEAMEKRRNDAYAAAQNDPGMQREVAMQRQFLDAMYPSTSVKPVTIGTGAHGTGTTTGAAGDGKIIINFPLDLSDPMSQIMTKVQSAINEMKQALKGQGLDSSNTGGSRFS